MGGQGTDGVDQAVCNMREYSLLRDDLDGLLEVTQWPDNADQLKGEIGEKNRASPQDKMLLTAVYGEQDDLMRAIPMSLGENVMVSTDNRCWDPAGREQGGRAVERRGRRNVK